MSTAAPASNSGDTTASPALLTPRKILRFYIPLALSWILMAVEGPTVSAAISRKALPELNLAAFLILMSVGFWIESPIVDLLTTSTTLCSCRRHYRELRRFTVTLIAGVTAVHLLFALTPLYWVLTERLIGVDHSVALAGRLGLIVLLPWAPSIGWRRFMQGVLIRFNQTRYVAWGTATRVIGMSLTALVLYQIPSVPGAVLGGGALSVGVLSESIFIHFATRKVIANDLSDDSDEPPLGLRKIVNFHVPLTATPVAFTRPLATA